MKKIGILSVILGLFMVFDVCAKEVKMTKKILMVVTNVDHIGEHKTGLWLEEYSVPYVNFKNEGYEITVASPLGGKTPIDPASMKKFDTEWSESVEKLNVTKILSELNYKEYDAIVLPGGHGPLIDLANDKFLSNILGYFNDNNLIIAAICHGPAGLVSADATILKGRRITGFSNKEENLAGLDKIVPFALETKLKELGVEYSAKEPWSSYVVVDKNLITGQNPQSSKAFARAIINTLNLGK